jgi:hypothetical protein
MSSQMTKHSPISDIGAWVDGRWEGEGLLQMANGSSYQGVCVCVCVRERERERDRETICRVCVYVCPPYVRGDFSVRVSVGGKQNDIFDKDNVE